MHSHNFATIITRKILRVNKFAIFCEFDRALTPVAPRVSLGRRPLRSVPALRICFCLPVDAMVEFYFENWDAFNCFYASEEFKRLSAHGAGFIGSIDTYLVQSHTVVEHPSDGGYWL